MAAEMELGCFDEDIFGTLTPQCKVAKPAQIYQPKQCEAKWFFDVKAGDNPKDKFHVKKCQADWFYHRGQFRKALTIYKELQKCTPSNNSSLLREMIESTARCLMKQGKPNDALVVMSEMLDSQSEDASLWLLSSQIHGSMESARGEIECLQSCITLNTWNQQCWHSLALAYERVSELLSRSSAQKISSEGFDVQNNKENPRRGEVQEKPNRILFSVEGDEDFEGKNKCLLVQPKATSNLITDKMSNGCSTSAVKESDEQHSANLTNLTSERTCSALDCNLENLVEQVQVKLSMCNRSLQGTIDETADASGCDLSASITNKDSCCEGSLAQGADGKELGGLSCMPLSQQGAGLAKDDKRLQESQSHFYSYCCLLKAKFLLEKSLEKSLSLLRSKNQELLHEVNRKVMAHVLCQCAKMRTQMQEHFTSLGVDRLSGEQKDWKTNSQLTCDEFEKFWFGHTMPSSSQQVEHFRKGTRRPTRS